VKGGLLYTTRACDRYVKVARGSMREQESPALGWLILTLLVDHWRLHTPLLWIEGLRRHLNVSGGILFPQPGSPARVALHR
jgi:hypothetical protein